MSSSNDPSQKKDLTGLLDYAKALEDAGQAPPVPEGAMMEEPKIEKLDEFESLDDLPTPASDSLSPPPEGLEPIPSFEEPAPIAQAPPEATLDKVRQYSEQITPSRAQVPAAYPFSLLITGWLAPEEKARLLDLVSRENMGIREMDLEPQFESGRILIPRISEYAGVLIVSALRTARAKFRFGPSDQVFATADTHDETDPAPFDTGLGTSSASSDSSHPAEELPVTTASQLPGEVRMALIDVVTASAALKTLAVEAERSPEYQELIEALSRELKYKAFHKGAHAIVDFSVQLTPLRQPSHYRVLVTGSAVRRAPQA
jgi:hypothetical protein